jgi:tRNA (mo5U34)-methyltransferase
MLQFLQLPRDPVNGALYQDLRDALTNREGFSWLRPLLEESEHLLASDRHGDLPAWRKALAELPEARHFLDGALAAPRLGAAVDDPEALRATLMKLHPWRKGPLESGGVRIDTEWRSDWKWDRVSSRLDLQGHTVLDVGCGNGYFGWRMLDAGAKCVIGVDPTLVFVMQWLACRHFAGSVHNYVLPVGVEALPQRARVFDTVFSMGVLYHRKDPSAHLAHLARLVRPGGRIVLETLVLDRPGQEELVPEARYARMRNVWSVPTIARLREWLHQAGLGEGELLDVSPTTTEEQRSTEWMRFESLDRCLDPDDPGRTVEGYPAPVRAALLVPVCA